MSLSELIPLLCTLCCAGAVGVVASISQVAAHRGGSMLDVAWNAVHHYPLLSVMCLGAVGVCCGSLNLRVCRMLLFEGAVGWQV